MTILSRHGINPEVPDALHQYGMMMAALRADFEVVGEKVKALGTVG